MKLLVGTANAGKIIEISAALADSTLELLTPRDLSITGEPSEDFDTLRDNALHKARWYFERGGGLPTIAEDTGLYVDAISDELGVKTRRWGAGPSATDAEWLAHFLARMDREENRNAKFVAVLAYIDATGNERVFESDARGTILRAPKADYLPGLPVSSVFLPEGYNRVFSGLTHDEKNTLSHRGKALKLFLQHLSDA